MLNNKLKYIQRYSLSYYIYIQLRLKKKRTKVASTARKYWGFRRFTGVCYVRQFVQDRYIKAYSMLDNLYRIAFSFFVEIECYLDIIFIFVVEIKKAFDFLWQRVCRRLLASFKNMANIRIKKEPATSMSCLTIQKFKTYYTGQHPLGKFTYNNRRLLEHKVSGPNALLLFTLICNCVTPNDDVLECITVDLNHKYYDDVFTNRTRFNVCRSELEDLMVIKKVHPDNTRCTLYYLNPSFYNVLSLSQRMMFRDSYSHLFAGFGD